MKFGLVICLVVASATAWTFQSAPSTVSVGRNTIHLPSSLDELEANGTTHAFSLPFHHSHMYVELTSYYDASWLALFDDDETLATEAVVTVLDAAAVAIKGDPGTNGYIQLINNDVQFMSDDSITLPAEDPDTEGIDACLHRRAAAGILGKPRYLSSSTEAPPTLRNPALRRTPADVHILFSNLKYNEDLVGCTKWRRTCEHDNWIVASAFRNSGAYDVDVFTRVVGYLIGLHLGTCPFGDAPLPLDETAKTISKIEKYCTEERGSTAHDPGYISNSNAGLRTTVVALDSEMVMNDATALRMIAASNEPVLASTRSLFGLGDLLGGGSGRRKDVWFCYAHPPKWYGKNQHVCGNGHLEHGETCDPTIDGVPTGGNSTHCLMCKLRTTAIGSTPTTAFVSTRRTCDNDTIATAIICTEDGTHKDDETSCIASSTTGEGPVGRIVRGECLHKNELEQITGHSMSSSSDSDDDGYDAMVVGGIALGGVLVLVAGLVIGNWGCIKSKYQELRAK